MKKQKKYIILLFLVFLICIFFYDYFHTKKSFNKKLYGITLEIEKGIFLRSLLTEYYIEYGQFPESISEIDSLYFSSEIKNENNIIARKNYLIDPFAKKGSYFFYKPIYDKNTKLREGYIILSRGLDGKINNFFKDTLFLRDSFVINDYLNPDDILSYKKIKFNYLDKYFGKKDYYLNPFYATGKELMIMNTCGCITFQQLIKNIERDFCWKIVCLKCPSKNLFIRNKYLVFSKNGIIINISFKNQIPKYFNSDTINIIGIVKEKNDNTIYINSAFIFYPEKYPSMK